MHPIMNPGIKKFIMRSLVAALPLLLLVGIYVVRDPFHVVHPVASTEHGDSVVAGNNAGVIAVQTYLAHNCERRYDSFIFGSSMSQNYKAAYWQPYIDKNASILHFDASGESLDGIINKMRFLNEHGSTIKNALIIIEEEMLHRPPHENEILYVQHPATSGASRWFHFHTLFFNAFRNLDMVKEVLQGTNDVVSDNVIKNGDVPNRIEPINENYYHHIDSLIEHDPSKFFTPQRLAGRQHAMLPFHNEPAINEVVEAKLRTIKEFLVKNKTKYIILVPPCNVKPQLKPQDLWVMRAIFGQEHVHDFSGAEGYVGNELFYYDKSAHLTSAQCKVLLDSAYKEQHTASLHNPYYRLK